MKNCHKHKSHTHKTPATSHLEAFDALRNTHTQAHPPPRCVCALVAGGKNLNNCLWLVATAGAALQVLQNLVFLVPNPVQIYYQIPL